MLGLSVDFLSLIERGRNAPSFEKLEIMAKGLGKPVAYFFAFGSTESEPQKKTSSRTRRAK
jgi:transcriptional regulator with XRE-family HTH domain